MLPGFRVILLATIVSVGGLEALIHTVHAPPETVITSGALAEPPVAAPRPAAPDGAACSPRVDGHYAQIGLLQSVPVESPCD